YYHGANRLEVTGKIDANLKSLNGGRNTAVRSDRLVALLIPGQNEKQPDLKSLELFDNVWIETTERSARQSTIETAYAFYDRPADRFELKNGVHIVTGTGETSDIKSTEATYEQSAGNVQLNGNAEITRGGAYIRGNTLNAKLNEQKHLTNAVVTGAAYLKNAAADRTTEISANEMNAEFDDTQQVKNANASGNAKATVTPTGNESYTSFSIATPGVLKAAFRPGGLPSTMNAQDRPTVQLNVPAGTSDAANKRVVADNVNVVFNDNG